MNKRLFSGHFAGAVFRIAACAIPTAMMGMAEAAEIVANFTSATTIPVTAASYTATGNTVTLTLNFEPPTGTNLTVVRNTGLAFIQGTFGNLAQGQRLNLSYAGVSYPFVADYFGGTGNDLVLRWGNTRTFVWGRAFDTFPAVPMAQPPTGALVGKSVFSLVGGAAHCLALCDDGSLAAWGRNEGGQLGNGTYTGSAIPVSVVTTGALAGKRVVAIGAGFGFNLALCSDGTLAAWGSNYSGQLGNGSYTTSNVPVAVSTSGALAGKKVVAISAGDSHCLALCSDGTLVGWGSNGSGQLGNNSTTDSTTPVAVLRTGVLSGKAVNSITAGRAHSLVLCSDGTLAAWGFNWYGQLGNNSDTNSKIPVAVVRSGALAGKTVTAIAAGYDFNLVLCSDNTLAAWGSAADGVLGSDVANNKVPGIIARTGALAGMTVRWIAAGSGSAYAWFDDGSLAAWGANYGGVLGNGSTSNSPTPVAVNSTALRSGERIRQISSGTCSPAIWATVSSPVSNDATLAGLSVSSGIIKPPVSPESTSYVASVITGTTAISVTPVATDPLAVVTVNGIVVPAGSASPLVPLPTAAIVIRVIAPRGASKEYTVTTQGDPRLAGLALNGWSLSPAFVSDTLDYAACVSADTTSVALAPTAVDGAATITVNGAPVGSGTTSGQISLPPGITDLTVEVVTAGATTAYRVRVLRPEPLAVTFDSPETVGMRVAGYTATGNTVSLALNHAPEAGTALRVVDNTGTDFIRGMFTNCAQGQLLTLGYQGVNYRFVANYFGGTGNDLVLQWADNRVFAWGRNYSGQLGNGLTSDRQSPFPVVATGVLAGRTLAAIDARSSHSLALGVDGKLAAWGSNDSGQLGNNSTAVARVPVAVISTGVLAGKMVAAVAAGGDGNLALCSDGTLVTWGNNSRGQLGNGGTTTAYAPVAVKRDGVIAGREAVAIASGGSHCLALLADGTLVAWGFNESGQLGDGTQINRYEPVAVDQRGILAGRTITAIAANTSASYALCSDGVIAAWGNNDSGELGNPDWTLSTVPILARTAGVLAGKSVVSMITRSSAVYALCTDGSLVVWGSNWEGILGDGTTNNALLPIDITQQGVLAGRRVGRIGACTTAGYASCLDGTFASWGYDYDGQLGNGDKPASLVPDLADVAALGPRNRITALAGGLTHGMSLVATALSDNSTLAAITLNNGTLSPTFSSGTSNYTVSLPNSATSITVTPTATDANAAIRLNGVAIASGAPSPVALGQGPISIALKVIAQNGAATTYTIRIKRASVFSGYTATTPYQTPATVGLPKLLAKASDPDGDAISITPAGPVSANGGAVVLLADAVRYTPPDGFSGTDTFTIVLTDSGGASITGPVTVQVGSAPNVGTPGANTNPPKLTTLPGGKMGLSFQGIPGRSYVVQRSIGGLDDWQTLATVTADATGKISFTDENPPPGSAFYRLGSP
ncbi:MAG: cadherin-like beta sandwich domain-containing protein [Verrucomicrobia bacterium]|nr:cadherin-like beta sandwich domain-containing protein [Verrucomicrobiota bacterium]